MSTAPQRAALLIVDVEEDFCEPHGSLAVKGGRELAIPINQLLEFPGFILKVAAKDFHPPGHISFASRHAGAILFKSEVIMTNPENSSEQITTKVYPDHCVQGTRGCEIIPEIHTDSLDAIIPKGTHKNYESFSAFGSPFRNPRVHLTELHNILTSAKINSLYVVGLSYNVCVYHTAVDAAELGYQSFVIKDATASRQSPEELIVTQRALEDHGVSVITMDSEELHFARSTDAAT